MNDPWGRELDVYDMSGGYIVFVGVQGSDGVFVLHPGKDWVFHRAGSLVWDSFNQGAYRNFRYDKLTEGDLKELGVSLPQMPRELPGGIAWHENFKAVVGVSQVPAAVLKRLREAGPVQPVYVVLCEDIYETRNGDGKFLYAVAVFWDETGARELIRKKIAEEPEDTVGCAYTIKRVELLMDADRKELRADLRLELFEHCSIDKILELLAP